MMGGIPGVRQTLIPWYVGCFGALKLGDSQVPRRTKSGSGHIPMFMAPRKHQKSQKHLPNLSQICHPPLCQIFFHGSLSETHRFSISTRISQRGLIATIITKTTMTHTSSRIQQPLWWCSTIFYPFIPSYHYSSNCYLYYGHYSHQHQPLINQYSNSNQLSFNQ